MESQKFKKILAIASRGKNILKRINNNLERHNKIIKSLLNVGTLSSADFPNAMREESEKEAKNSQRLH